LTRGRKQLRSQVGLNDCELFRFLRKLVQSPGQLGESDWKAVLGAGWTPTEVDAAIYQAARFQFMNTIATGNLIPVAPIEVAMSIARERHGPDGYAALAPRVEEASGIRVEMAIEVRSGEPAGGS
jgi:hypothetical protein